jgi:autotransporter-associated beta strand protein
MASLRQVFRRSAFLLATIPAVAVAQVFYSEDFEDGNAATRWTVSQAGETAAADFAFDYGLLGIPAAPGGTGTRGLKMEANIGATGGASTILAFPDGQSFSTAGGSYTLEFDVWMNWADGTGTTEFSIFGVGHTSTEAQVPNSSTPGTGPSNNGLDFAFTGEDGAARDVRVYLDGAEQTGDGNLGGYIRQPPAVFIQDEYVAPYFFAYDGETPGNQWLEVSVRVDSDQAQWTVNDQTWATPPVAVADGNIMLGYMDVFSSQAGPELFGIYDNVQVIASPAETTELVWAGDGVNPGGFGTWANLEKTWLGAVEASTWQWNMPAIFEGTGSSITISGGGVTAGGGLDFRSDGYVISGDPLWLGATSLTGPLAKRDNQIFDTNASTQINVAAGVTTTILSDIRGRQGLTKTGPGTLVFEGIGLIDGTTRVSEGTLRLTDFALVLPNLGTSTIQVDAGATLDVSAFTFGFLVEPSQTLAGTGTVQGSVAIQDGGRLRPGNSPGTLTISGDVFFGPTGNYNWQVYDAAGTAGSEEGWGLVEIGGALDVSATDTEPFSVNLWSLSGLDPDASGDAINFSTGLNYTWRIATATGGITGFSSDKFLINVAENNGAAGFSNDLGGGTFSIVQSGNDLNLVYTSANPSTDIVINVPSGTQTQAEAGYPTIAAATSLTKTGAGTVVFDAANAYTGPTTVSAGTLEVANADALAATAVTVDTGGTLAVASGTTMRSPSVIVDGGSLSAGSLAVNATTGITSLAINAGGLAGSPAVEIGSGGELALVQDARVSVAVGSLTVAETTGGGRVDLGAGEIEIAAGGISATDLRADLIAGRNGGAWNGSSGIMSAAAAASGGTREVGYVVSGDGSATVSFAAPGDTDLSGQVNVFDLIGIDATGKFGSGAASVWSEGDFNYDGVTNIFDLIGIDSSGAYGAGDYFPASPTAAGTITAVPEPGTLLGLVAGGFALAAAARRTRSRPIQI